MLGGNGEDARKAGPAVRRRRASDLRRAREWSMQQIEDERWRQAARMLELDLVGADGKIVPNERGAQGDAMRGRIDGQRIHVRYGARDARDRTTVLDVVLR